LEHATIDTRITARPTPPRDLKRRTAQGRTAPPADTRPRCATCRAVLLPPDPSAARFTSEPPPGQCVMCFRPRCDVCHTRPVGQARRFVSDPRIGQRALRPAYLDRAVTCVRLCDLCDAQELPHTEADRLERQLLAQRSVVREMRQHRGTTAGGGR
jgi:hypothetical protein